MHFVSYDLFLQAAKVANCILLSEIKYWPFAVSIVLV